ncbi:MAG: GNAT family N-acetyltransferase [Sulfitobacter sp.]
MKIRQATIDDIPEICTFLMELTAIGKRRLPSDAAYVRSHYIEHPDAIQCAVAQVENGDLLGLQILKHASEGNPYGVTTGWGIIGTHVRPSAARRGIGKALFAATLTAAKAADLKKIDATIGSDNQEGLAYYDAIGFRSYKDLGRRVCKCFDV